MTRAKDISKIVTDADLSGTLDVAGDLTVNGIADVDSLVIDNAGKISSLGQIELQVDTDNNQSGTYIGFSRNNTTSERLALFSENGDISFYEDTGTTPKFFWDSSAESLTVDGVVTVDRVINATTSSDPWLKGVNGSNTETFFLKPSGQAYFGGNLGINETSPLGKLHVKSGDSGASVSVHGDELVVEGSANSGISILSGNSNTGVIYFGDDGDNNVAEISYDHSANAMKFFTSASERMRIDSSGNVMIGTTVTGNAGGITMLPNNSAGAGTIVFDRSSTSNISTVLLFENGNSPVGSITHGSGGTNFNTTSDHRLKENVVAMADATTRLKQLQPKRFNFMTDADTTVDGFLAHEVQSVVPEAITGTHNEVDADGDPVYQGIDQSKLVPLLVKTIQELEARITALENGE